MKVAWISIVACRLALCAVAASPPASNVFESAATATPPTVLDKIIDRKLAQLGIRPAFCSDAVFVRRAYLDVIGTLPTAAEARDFIRDPDPGKRVTLIDRLLMRPEFADYWAMKWSDLLRVKAEFPVNLWPNAAQAYHHWIRTSVRDNLPYDRFARELLTANGSNFRVGPVNFYRAMQNRTPEGIATTVALTFMGTRADRWPTNRLGGLAVFFSQVTYKPTREWKEEVVFWDPDKDLAPPAAAVVPAATLGVTNGTNRVSAAVSNGAPPTVTAPPVPGGPLVGVFPDGKKIKLSPARDPRAVFADWLITPRNPWFTRNIANRTWAWLMGRGIIHEPDDIRPDNPPSNPALLECLEKHLVASRYDLKALFRLILTSRAYQYSSIVPKAAAAAGEAQFAFYPLRQLDAEVLIDAINRVTGSSDLYTSPIPEPFTFIPENKPAIALPDGSITSAFLELFGRPARATGLENERSSRPTPSQRMHLLNSSHIQRKLEESDKLKALTDPARKPQEVLDDLYLTILARHPTADEAASADAYVKSGVADARGARLDLVWALINSEEFRHRH
jgi:hypothetical protein